MYVHIPVADPESYKGGFQTSTHAKCAANFCLSHIYDIHTSLHRFAVVVQNSQGVSEFYATVTTDIIHCEYVIFLDT